jgi:hypothetical protein
VPSARLTTIDRALLQALRVWGRAADDRFWNHVRPSWRDRLRAGWDLESARAAERDHDLSELRTQDQAERRLDFARIDASWLVRALKEESPSVQRAVAAHAPDVIAEVLRAGLALRSEALVPDRPPHPEALRWALALWSERLVGGPEVLRDDPLVVITVTQLKMQDRVRLLNLIGLAKRAWALEPSGPPAEPRENLGSARQRDQHRLHHFQALWGQPDPTLVAAARADLATVEGRDDATTRLGLVTIGRLLSAVDPYRLRWVLQHLPYPFAKEVRSLVALKHAHLSESQVLAWESRIFRAACDRLRDETSSGPGGDEPP